MSPATTLNNVVLPAPLGPRTANRSPWATSRSMPPKARSPPNATDTERSLSSVVVGSVSEASGVHGRR